MVSQVPGGAANVQDIYPLAPLQEGIQFHHLMETAHDPCLMGVLMSFTARDPVDRYIDAMQRVVDRHDILRTAILWEGLTELVQVVCRKAMAMRKSRCISVSTRGGGGWMFAGAGWERWTSRINEYDSPGNRMTMMRLPHVSKLAEIIEGEMSFGKENFSVANVLSRDAAFT